MGEDEDLLVVFVKQDKKHTHKKKGIRYGRVEKKLKISIPLPYKFELSCTHDYAVHKTIQSTEHSR